MHNNVSSASEEVSASQQDFAEGYSALGLDGETCVLWSYVLQNVKKLSPAEFTQRGLKAVCGANWCNANYKVCPDSGVPYFDHQRLADDIMKACQRIGPFRESK